MAKRKKAESIKESVDGNSIEKERSPIDSYLRGLNKFKLTDKQKELLKVLDENELIFIVGPAGTSKTWISCYYAIREYAYHKYDGVVMIKPIIESGEKIGYLPGSYEDKINPHYESFKTNLVELIGGESVTKLLEKNIFEFKPVTFMRGINIKNRLILADEVQNFDAKTIVTFVSRKGIGSKLIIAADISQNDIDFKYMALPWFMDLIKDIKGVAIFQFNNEDNMRDPFLIEILKRYEEAKATDNIPKNKYN